MMPKDVDFFSFVQTVCRCCCIHVLIISCSAQLKRDFFTHFFCCSRSLPQFWIQKTVGTGVLSYMIAAVTPLC